MLTTIFVFGSNTEGRHGKGAALYAKEHYGAIYGKAKGYQGKSYAIITKDLSKGKRSISLEYIDQQIKEFNKYTWQDFDSNYIISALGMSLAGYTKKEIKGLFVKYTWPDTVFFHSKFL